MSDETPQFYRDFFPEPQQRQTPTHQVSVERAVPYAMKAINDELRTLGTAPEGRRNEQLNVSGFNLAQLVAGGYADHTEVYGLLRETALAIGLTASETDKTLASAFDAGSRQPRVIADLDKRVVPEATVLHFDPPLLVEVEDEAGATVERLFPRLDWVDLFAKDEEEEWILKPLIPARRLVALYSPPKVGKSLLMLELAANIARGHRSLGEKPKQMRVLYVDFENDPRGDIRTRLKAMGLAPHHLEDLVYLSFPSMAYLDTAMGGVQLLAVAQHYGCLLVIIDTVSRAVGGEENANDTWLGFYKNTGLRLKAAGIACLRLDHTGKDESKGMRGGSAKYGDVDAVWSMTKVSDDTYRLECTANRLPIIEKVLVLRRESEPNLHHRIDPKGEAALWDDVKEARIAALDAKYGTGKVGPVREVQDVLRAATGSGITPRNLPALLAERDRRNGVVVLDEGLE